jgi:cytochrome c oxidase assembly protein subunit 11
VTQQSDKNTTDNTKQENNRVIGRLLILVVAMFGFGFALVPLYDVFCDVTGINGKTGGQVTLSETMKVDTTREVKIEFIATLNETMPWEFKPMVRSVKVHPGKPTRIEYLARNRTSKTIIGQAVPSVAPGLAAQYFQKTECFCFTEQKLKAGEEKRMPVVFVIDPALPDDIHELTLSYTFFVKPGSEGISDKASLALNTNQEI